MRKPSNRSDHDAEPEAFQLDYSGLVGGNYGSEFMTPSSSSRKARLFAGPMAALLLSHLSAPPAAAQSDDVGFDIEINHVGISVANLEESVDWYREMLGFELVRPINRNPESEMTIALLRRGSFNIELFEIEGAAPLPEYRRDPSADLRVHGLAHFAFRVEDARAVLAELESKGVEIVFGPNESERSIFFFVNDNSGNSFEFIQLK